MNIITIGDLHGSPAWKEINPGEWDRMVFMGDLVDSPDYSDEDILQNLEEIISLKKSFPDKVILLWGNHDLAYLYGGHRRHYASGFRKKMLPALFSTFNNSRKLFNAAFGSGSHLWTHAGVVQRWFNTHVREQIMPSDTHLANTLNRLFDAYYEPLFHAGLLRGGLHEDGGIFWADMRETFVNPLRGYHQVIGHTKTRDGILVSDHFGAYTSVTYVDCLDTATEFLKLEL
jgi:hypothetical protein